MEKTNHLQRQLDIIAILKKGPMPLEALLEKVSKGQKINKRTFIRDANRIEDLFGYHIQYHRFNHTYSIENVGSEKQNELLYYYKMIALWEEYQIIGEKVFPQVKSEITQNHFNAVLACI